MVLKIYTLFLLFIITKINCNQQYFSVNKNNENKLELKIMSHNIFIMPKIGELFEDSYNKKQRIEEIKKSDYWKNADILVFQEAFDKYLVEDLKNELRKNGYIYQTKIIGINKIKINGGVFIVSKLQFEEEPKYKIYEKSCGSDYLLYNKGFIHIKIKVEGIPVNIIGTHTQFDDKKCIFNNPKNIRFEQLNQISIYINQNIKNEEIIILVGDLNINKNSDEYKCIIQKYNLSEPLYESNHNYTYDTINNSIAKDRDSKLSFPEGPLYLDYTFLENNNNLKINQKVLKINSNNYEWKNKTYCDFSDHYPIISTLILN